MFEAVRSTIVADESQRLQQVDGLLAELIRLLLQDGLPKPPEQHANLAREPFGFRMHPPRVVRTLFVSQHASSDSAVWITWTDGEGDHGAYVSPAMMWAVWPLVTGLVARLHGDELELAYAIAGERPVLARSTWVHPNGWWDSWKSRPLDHVGQTIGQVYREHLYPAALETLGALEIRGTVVDVCGGDGELGEQIAALGAEVVLVDRNLPSTVAARERVARVVQGDASVAATWDEVGPVDAAVLVGAISGNVMRREDALAVMAHVVGVLQPGGWVVVTGWNPCLLEAPDFRRLGLEVHNCVVPPAELGMLPRQHYVLRRSV